MDIELLARAPLRGGREPLGEIRSMLWGGDPARLCVRTDMERACVLRTIARADGPREVADTLMAARGWLSTYPDDDGCRDAMIRMLARERLLFRD